MSSEAKPKESKMLNEYQLRVMIVDEIGEINKLLKEMRVAWDNQDVEHLHSCSDTMRGLTTELLALLVVSNDRDLFPTLHKAVREMSYSSLNASDGQMDFPAALCALKSGHRVTNRCWNGQGMYLSLQTPDENSKMGLPYIYIYMPKVHPLYPGKMVPWTPSQLDIMSEGWFVCDD